MNDAYDYCFDVDLVKMGCMKIGSQLDAYFNILALKFDGSRVRDNFALLPKPDKACHPKCSDGVVAKAREPPVGKEPDGGKPRYYVPVIVRRCGKNDGHNQQCKQCKKVKYCSRECQVADWKTRHKQVCKTLAV